MIKKCLKCGKEFEVKTKTHWLVKYCSKSCRLKVAMENFILRRAKELETKGVK